MKRNSIVLAGIAIMLMFASIGVASSGMTLVYNLGETLPDINLTDGQTLTIKFIADPGSVITYGALPEGATFDQATFTFTWTAEIEQKGIYPLSFSGFLNSLAVTSTVSVEILDCRVQVVATGLDYIWSPNNKLVEVEIILLDSAGNRADIEILSVEVVDILRKSLAEEKESNGKGKGLLKEVHMPSALLNGKKDGEFLDVEGSYFLRATRLGLIEERTYVISFRATYPLTSVVEVASISISIPHDMSEIKPDVEEEDEETEEEIEEEEETEDEEEGPKKEKKEK